MQLTQEQSEFILAEVKAASRRIMIGRRLIPTPPPVGFGLEVIGYDKLTEMAQGRTDLEWGAGFSDDTIALTRSKLPMPVHHKEFKLNRRQVEASQRSGTPLPTVSVDAATYAVSKQEDEVILKGYSVDGTTYENPGLYAGAGNTDTGADFTTATNIPVSAQQAVAKLAEDNIPGPYSIVLNPTQYNETFALIGTASDAMYYDYLIKRFSAVDDSGMNAPGRVFSSTVITAATGMVVGPPFLKKAEYQLGQDITAEMGEEEKTKNTWGIVYCTGTPLIYDANVICTLTTI